MISWAARRVEVDETYVGGREPTGGNPGRQTKTKSIVAIAAEVRGRGHWPDPNEPRRGCGCELSLIPFVNKAVAPGATVRTDAGQPTVVWRTKAMTASRRSISASGDPAHIVMPRVASRFRDAALLDRWWLGIHHGAIDAESRLLSRDEFTFRFNRRRSPSQARGLLFFRLLQQAVQHEPVPYKGLVGGHRSLGNQM